MLPITLKKNQEKDQADMPSLTQKEYQTNQNIEDKDK